MLLLGYYGYGNFGDELMRLGIEDFLRKFQIQYVTALRKRTGGDTIGRFNLIDLVGALYETDVLVYGGGGLFQDVTSLKSFLYYASVVELSLLMGKPVVLFGNSLGPLRRSISRCILRRLLRHPKVFLFARDVISYRYGAAINKNTVLCCDPAVRYLRRLDAPQEKRYDLVIVPRRVERVSTYGFLKKYFERILVLPGQDKDIPVARSLAGALKSDLFTETQDTLAALEHLLSARFVLSERFHPNVVAAYYGTPFVSLENSKTERFFRKYTKRREFFARELWEVEERIELVRANPLFLKDEMDREAEESYRALLRVLTKLAS